MKKELVVIIGMTLMYLVSLFGLILAWIHYRKHQKT
jgi:hypothetical protein